MYQSATHAVLKHVRSTRLPRELVALYTHRTILRVGFGLTSVFTAVFVYQQFNNSLFAALLVFGGINAFVIFLTPLSAKLLAHFGIKTLILAAMPPLVIAVAGLFLATLSVQYLVLGVSIYAVGATIYKVLYWVPYQIDITRLLDKKRRGTQLALLNNAADIAIITTPLLGGIIVASFGFSALFLVGVTLMLLGAIPLLWITNTYERFQWSYVETFKKLFAPKHRRLLLAYVGDGIQSGTLNVIWPLFVFLLLSQRYVALGVIAALTLFAILILRSVTGGLFDKWDKRRVLMIGAVVTSLGWVSKLFVVTPIQVFSADTFHGMGRVVNRTSIEAMTYEQAADNGRYVDEYTALKEISLYLGRTLILGFAGVVLFFFEAQFAFLAAIAVSAIASLSTMLLAQRVSLS